MRSLQYDRRSVDVTSRSVNKLEEKAIFHINRHAFLLKIAYDLGDIVNFDCHAKKEFQILPLLHK